MAHFAQLDENNTVLNVIVISNNDVGEPNFSFPQTDIVGQHFINNTLKILGTWKQTSYNGSFRKNYAGIGHIYDPVRDAFIPQKPYNSWLLNENSCLWEAPIPYPSDGKNYSWDENLVNWTLNGNT